MPIRGRDTGCHIAPNSPLYGSRDRSCRETGIRTITRQIRLQIKGGFGCGHFHQVGEILAERGDSPIDWQRPW